MTKTQFYSIFTPIFLTFFLGENLQAQVTGKVFRDFNADGVHTTAAPDPIEPGLKDVTVNAYDAGGGPYTATTAADGKYTISGGSGPYRVEFILPAFYYASNGSAANTTVQFVAAGGTANLGVNYPADYCQSNPFITTPQYTSGNPLGSGSASLGSGLIGTNYLSTGKLTANRVATIASVGATWGIAYQKKSNNLYAAAFLKRHVGLGALGLGGVYQITNPNSASPSVNQFLNLTSLGINLGTIPDNVARGLSDNKADPSADSDAFVKIGKVGIGDLDLSEDGKTLWLVNLFDKKIYSIFINEPTQTPSVANVNSFAIPNPNCSNGEFVPFGLKYFKGKIYIGVTCTAQTSQNYNDLNATVYEFDPSNNSFNNVLSFPLTYTKGQTDAGVTSFDNKWNPWEDTWHQDGGGEITYPQAILSDIEIDKDGSLILGFMDRTGHQGGFENVDLNGNGSYLTVAGGDILRAANINGNFILENNGTVGGLTGCGVGNNEGPNGGEFYCGEKYTQWHNEIIVGGLALLMGQNEVIATGYDTDIDFNAGGTIRLSNINGDKNASNQFFKTVGGSGTFAKANGLGDIELLCNAAPIEIGNRVFMDTDSDGIQDGDEMGLDGINVELWKAGAKVTDVTTANGGQWFFSNLDADTDYEIKILAADIPSGKGLTTKDATSTGVADVADSDASLVGSDAVIAYTTGSAGQNNHTLDFGFKVACLLASTAATINPTCANNDGAINLMVTNATGTPTYLWSNGATSEDLSAISAGDYTVTVTDAACTAVATYSVSVTPANQISQLCIGESYKLEIQDNTLTGIQWKKDGVDIAGANALTYTATQVGVYTYTSNGVGGCAVGQCCPIELTLNPSCCKPKVCTTVKITRN